MKSTNNLGDMEETSEKETVVIECELCERLGTTGRLLVSKSDALEETKAHVARHEFQLKVLGLGRKLRTRDLLAPIVTEKPKKRARPQSKSKSKKSKTTSTPSKKSSKANSSTSKESNGDTKSTGKRVLKARTSEIQSERRSPSSPLPQSVDKVGNDQSQSAEITPQRKPSGRPKGSNNSAAPNTVAIQRPGPQYQSRIEKHCYDLVKARREGRSVKCRRCGGYLAVVHRGDEIEVESAIRHVYSHLGDVLFACKHCDSTLEAESSIKRHLLSDHKLGGSKGNYDVFSAKPEDAVIQMITECFGGGEGQWNRQDFCTFRL